MKRNKPHPGCAKRCSSFLLLAFSLVSLSSSAEVRLLTESDAIVPNRTVEIETNSIVVTYEFPEISQISTDNGVYYSIPGFGYCNEVGKPKLPMRVDTFRVPSGFTATVEAEASGAKIVPCIYYPVQEPVYDDGTVVSSGVSLTPYSGVFPQETASIVSTYTLRGESIAEVGVSPVQYCYNENTATLYEKIVYRITFSPANTSAYQSEAVQFRDNTEREYGLKPKLRQSLVSNANKIGDVDLSDTEGFEGTEGYLVVTTDKYLGPVNTFLRWKKYLGYTTHVISKEEWFDSRYVLNTIRDFRKVNENIRYLLIVGDSNDVPPFDKFTSRGNAYVTDLYYGTSVNESYLPDLYMGRIPVNTEDEANGVFNKLVRLQMCPIEEEKFYKNAVHCAYFEPELSDSTRAATRYVQTVEEIHNYVGKFGISSKRFYFAANKVNPLLYSSIFGRGDSIPSYLRRPGFSWKITYGDITDKINKGCLYALYRGHGTPMSWKNVFFDKEEFYNLDNYELYPTIFSVTCNTGNFGFYNKDAKKYEDCFAEALLKMPFGGASAVIAASYSSYSGYNDAFIEGMIDAIWPNPGLLPVFNNPEGENVSSTPKPTYRLGQIMAQGLNRMNEQYGAVDKEVIKYQYELYHLFGDPSMYFFTEVPKPFSNLEIRRYDNEIYVTTHGEPASISFFNDEEDEAYRYETDEISFSTRNPEKTVVCVTGHNRLTSLDGVIIPIEDNIALRPQILSYSVSDAPFANVKVFPGEASQQLQISISDLFGIYSHSVQMERATDIQEIELPIPEQSGIYVISLIADGVMMQSKKIIKK